MWAVFQRFMDDRQGELFGFNKLQVQLIHSSAAS